MRRVLCLIALLAAAVVLAPDATRTHATFAGQNGRIVFEAEPETDNIDIFVMDGDGSNVTPLVTGPANDFDPVWSPDGTMIVFTSERDDPNRDIWVMNADGGDQVPVTTGPGQDFRPTWNNDGSLIVFRRSGDLYSVKPDGTGIAPFIVDLQKTTDDPDFSSDGTKLVFTNRSDGDFEIYLADADGSNPVKLTDNTAVDDEPSWSPDGNQIVFAREDEVDNNFSQVYVMNANGTGEHAITSGDAYNSSPDWSPDGTLIAFYSDRFGGEGDVFLMNPDGSNVQQLSQTSGFNPDWQRVALTQGNVDCDQDVDSVDALFELRDVAALSVNQPIGCPEIGSEIASLFGDIDCDDDVDAVDALLILRHVASLPVNQPEGCTDLGDPL